MSQDIVNTDRPVSTVTGLALVIVLGWAEQGFRWILSSSPRSRDAHGKKINMAGSAVSMDRPNET
jgi:hypothetical protein